MTNVSSVQLLLGRYQQIYQKVYGREPRALRDLGGGWVLVNGTRMHVSELERQTEVLQLEYRKQVAEKRSIIKRLIRWFADA